MRSSSLQLYVLAAGERHHRKALAGLPANTETFPFVSLQQSEAVLVALAANT